MREAWTPAGRTTDSSIAPLGPPPPPSSPAVSKTMRANRAKETGLEIALRRALRKSGLGGYRKNWKRVPGTPDIAYPGHRVAIFVHGCFWHRCPRCNFPLPRSHRDFWMRKFTRNEERDRRKIKVLAGMGWRVLVFWECEVSKDSSACAARVGQYLMHPSGRL